MNMCSYVCCSEAVAGIEEARDLSGLLKLVSDSSRLQILGLLVRGEHCVCQLVEHLQLSQSLISHHLRDLKGGGLIACRKDGKWSYYSLTPKGRKVTNLILKIRI